LIDECTQEIHSNRYLCHKCAYIKSQGELINYGRYRLCRGCAQKFEFLREKDKAVKIEDFVMTD
jgi:hypothetical protein